MIRNVKTRNRSKRDHFTVPTIDLRNEDLFEKRYLSTVWAYLSGFLL